MGRQVVRQDVRQAGGQAGWQEGGYAGGQASGLADLLAGWRTRRWASMFLVGSWAGMLVGWQVGMHGGIYTASFEPAEGRLQKLVRINKEPPQYYSS